MGGGWRRCGWWDANLKVSAISSARVEAAGDEVEALSPRSWEIYRGRCQHGTGRQQCEPRSAAYPKSECYMRTVVVATPSYVVTVVTLSTDNGAMTEAYPGLVDRRDSSVLRSNSTTTL